MTDLIGTGERRMVAPLTFDDGVTQGLPRSLVVGDFGSNFDGLPDLAGLSFRRLLNNGTPVTSLWIAEARNNGGLFPSQAMSRQPMVGDCALACAAGAFFRKIHDQRLLIVEDPSACFQIEPQMIDPRAPMIVDISWRGDELDLRCERLPVPSAEAGRANIEEVYVEDVDHDGQVDLIVRQGTNFLEEPPDSSGTFFFPAAYVYFGPLDASPEAVVITPSNPFNGFIGPFDVVDIDGDDLVDLVVFDLQGIGVGQLGRDGRYAVDSRLVAFETTEDEEIEPLPDERFGRDDPELFGQTAVRVLDANGDGLQDLMLLSDFEIIVGLRVVCTAAGAERGACERFEPGAEQ